MDKKLKHCAGICDYTYKWRISKHHRKEEEEDNSLSISSCASKCLNIFDRLVFWKIFSNLMKWGEASIMISINDCQSTLITVSAHLRQKLMLSVQSFTAKSYKLKLAGCKSWRKLFLCRKSCVQDLLRFRKRAVTKKKCVVTLLPLPNCTRLAAGEMPRIVFKL